MKKYRGLLLRLACTSYLAVLAFMYTADAQLKPPGYERAVQIEREKRAIPRLDRDSITIVDTVAVMDPVTNEETIQVITSVYSLRDYIRITYAMNDPDILLDGQPHVIIDPATYEEITIRLTPDNKIEVRPKQ